MECNDSFPDDSCNQEAQLRRAPNNVQQQQQQQLGQLMIMMMWRQPSRTGGLGWAQMARTKIASATGGWRIPSADMTSQIDFRAQYEGIRK